MASEIDLRPPPPCPAPFNLAAHVLARAADRPDKIALAVISPAGSERWSYGRLEEAVRRTAGGFLARGLGPGDRVLMRLGNSVDFPIAYLGAIAAGLVPVPTSAQLTVREITPIAAEIAPALIVAGDGIALPADCPAPVLGPEGFAALRAAAPAPYAFGDPERPAYIIYTSGSSGRPRAVIHAHRAVWARQMMIAGWHGLEATDRLFHAGHFNWTFTLGTGLLDPWSRGATALIPAAGVKSAQLPLLIARHDATILAAAPGVYRQILRQALPPLPKLRHGLSAGEKLPPPLRAAWEAATGRSVFEAFGMSECSTFISSHPSRPAPPEALGYVQAGRQVALLGSDGRPVPRGEPGVIAVGADDPGLMLGYLGAEEETRARYSADGRWFLTGDMGRMDRDGAIRYLGRNDDMMNAGGFRVSPVEVESAMADHPGIHEAAATGIEVRPGTTVIGLFYTADAPLDDTALAEFAARRLARYKCPRLFIHCEALPRNANGKLRRAALRQEYEDRLGQA